ncbi:uncharacterized protein [Apostichopus japonicus]|uniref:uncharacterized protein n=1 Tax=Stichopus japonicus TaxID=307972 RepID=UPI003AB6045C
MAQEMRGKDLSMVMDSPPAYQGKDRTKLYVVAISVIVVTILVGFFGVFFMLLSAPEPTIVNNLSNEVEAEDPIVITRSVSFEMGDGVQHHEVMTAKGDVLTIKSIGDGFVAIFDHGREIVMIKNQTSSTCYFTRLQEIPDMGMEDMDNVHPFYFQEIQPGSDLVPVDETVDLIDFSQSDLIPADYIKLTNSPAVSSQCSNGDSYWLTPQESGLAKRGWWPKITVCIHIKITF